MKAQLLDLEEKCEFVYVPGIRVWTPEGTAKKSFYVGMTHCRDSDGKIMSEPLNEMLYTSRGLRAGEWQQVLLWAQENEPRLADSMLGAPYQASPNSYRGYLETVATLIDHVHGLVIESPRVAFDKGKPNFFEMRGSIVGDKVWEVVIPRESGYVKDRKFRDFDEFFNIIYGMKDARKQVPDNAYIWIDPDIHKDSGLRMFFHTDRVTGLAGTRSELPRYAFNIAADWSPYEICKGDQMAFRPAYVDEEVREGLFEHIKQVFVPSQVPSLA